MVLTTFLGTAKWKEIYTLCLTFLLLSSFPDNCSMALYGTNQSEQQKKLLKYCNIIGQL